MSKRAAESVLARLTRQMARRLFKIHSKPLTKGRPFVTLGYWCSIAIVVLAFTGCGKKEVKPRALSPQESLRSFRLSDDLSVELFASEPEVVSPVEMVFDENGIAYVAEMLDYPEDPPPGKAARSRIRRLEDTDGDGKVDRSVIFAEQVLEVSGLQPWKGGLIVTSAPDILFMKDTDGDGKADLRQVLYTGFRKVNPESRVTNPRLGIDNWVYVANNGVEANITSPEHPQRPAVQVGGADFRFQSIRGLAEPASGPTQFGMTFDDWGNRFITQNTIHVRQVIVPMQYLMEAPLLEVPSVSQDISDHGRPSAQIFALTQPQAWRVERSRLRQQRYHEEGLDKVRALNPSTELVSGYFTAATGGTVYTGDQLPQSYRGNLFCGDVSANLVHRDLLRPAGTTLVASRAPGERNREFLASTDAWFRPCNLANAPDGNLYVIDIYREFIETPESIPDSIKKTMNFWSGDTMGRIYRILPKTAPQRRNLRPRLGSADTAALVKQLENPNGWHRQTAQRLLVERQDPTAAPMLKDLVEKSEFPQARIHALWTLEGLSALDSALVLKALRDPHPRVRQHALRLSEAFLPDSREVADAVSRMSSDPDPQVQLQLAFSLGRLKNARAFDTLGALAVQRTSDPWFTIAILSSVHDSAAPFLRHLLARRDILNAPQLLSGLAALVGAGHDVHEISYLLSSLSRLPQPESALAGLAKGLELGRVKGLRVPGAEAVLQKFLNSSSEGSQKAAWKAARFLELPALIQKASVDALASNLSAPQRCNALRTLRSGRYAAVVPVLRKVLESQAPPEIQIAAIESLASFEDAGAAGTLLTYWKTYGPEVRQKVINALVTRPEWMPALLTALDQRRVELVAIDAAARARLLQHPDPAVVQRARRLWQEEGGDRMKLMANYQDVLKMSGEPGHGKRLFEEKCGKCHLPRQGVRVGPDLSGLSNKTKEELLTSILNPSYAIDPRFVNYLVTTQDGRLHDGIIVNETPGTITLRGGSEDGSDQTLLRKSIAQIRASSVSLMPEDLEKSMSRQDLADVISYLRGGL